jgi:hypothetical protein
MVQTKVVEKIKTHFMFNKFFSENCAIYDTMGGILWSQTGHG